MIQTPLLTPQDLSPLSFVFISTHFPRNVRWREREESAFTSKIWLNPFSSATDHSTNSFFLIFNAPTPFHNSLLLFLTLSTSPPNPSNKTLNSSSSLFKLTFRLGLKLETFEMSVVRRERRDKWDCCALKRRREVVREWVEDKESRWVWISERSCWWVEVRRDWDSIRFCNEEKPIAIAGTKLLVLGDYQYSVVYLWAEEEELNWSGSGFSLVAFNQAFSSVPLGGLPYCFTLVPEFGSL